MINEFSVGRINSDMNLGRTQEVYESARQTQSLPTSNGSSFTEILQDSINKVNEYQVQADRSIGELVAGRNKNIHETLLTVERADSSLKLMMQVRNKVLEAYREIMRMQV